MRLTAPQQKRLSYWLFKHGTGSKIHLCEKAGITPPELTRLLTGGTMTDEKFSRVLSAMDRKKI